MLADVAGHDQADRLGLGVDPADAEVHRKVPPARPPKEVPLSRMEEPGRVEGLGELLQPDDTGAGEEVLESQRTGRILLQAGHPPGGGVEVDDGSSPGVEEEE